MIPLYQLDAASVACTPLGFPMCQNRLAVPTWSYAMELHPPKRIVELGTYNGGFTCAIGVHAYRIGTKITSYERARAPDENFAALGKFLGITFRDQVDMWACEGEISKLIAQPGLTYVLCDGGDKQRELATFAKYLKPGDVIASHDYHSKTIKLAPGEPHPWPWSEMPAEHGEAVAAANGLKPFLQEHFDWAGWLAFRKSA